MIKFTTSGRNELGDEEKTSLILEMMGRHSNLFLIDEPTQRILDLIKHVPADQNRVRTLMPGGTYVMPPKQDVINPYESLDGLANLILDNLDVKRFGEGVFKPRSKGLPVIQRKN